MASKAFVVLRISYSATPGESTLRKGFCRVAKYGETRLVPGPRSEVSSMAGEVVTGYHSRHAPVGIFRWLTTTNHHEIGILYLANSFLFFLIGGVLALLMRTELAYPGRTIVDASTYMELFTMHGTTMIFLVAIPILAGFGNLMVPPLMWPALFGVYSRAASYIVLLPAMGLISEGIPRMSHKPIFGYEAIALSTVAIGFLSFGVWVHHMSTTALSISARLPFMIINLAIAVPSGIKIFNWIATMWGGAIELKAPMLFAIGF